MSASVARAVSERASARQIQGPYKTSRPTCLNLRGSCRTSSTNFNEHGESIAVVRNQDGRALHEVHTQVPYP